MGVLILALSSQSILVKINPSPQKAVNQTRNFASPKRTVSQTVYFTKDARVDRLENYLTAKNSPLAKSARVFVESADEYGIDWKLLPAISGIESSFGLYQLPDSYNPFGWGGGYLYFDSFDSAIREVAKDLAQRAVWKGADTPEELGPSYCPPNYANWIRAVNQFMAEIEATEPVEI